MGRKIQLFQLSGVEASATSYKQMLKEQEEGAVKIAINPWFKEQAALTVLDYFNEGYGKAGDADDKALKDLMTSMGIDPTGGKPKVAHVGAVGDARKTAEAKTLDRPEAIATVLEITSWIEYLDDVIARREDKHLLVQCEGPDFAGFIDHDADEQVKLLMGDMRAWRRHARKDPEAMTELAELAKELGMDDAKAVLESSKTPESRAKLLGWSPFGMHQPLEVEPGAEETLEGADDLPLEPLPAPFESAPLPVRVLPNVEYAFGGERKKNTEVF